MHVLKCNHFLKYDYVVSKVTRIFHVGLFPCTILPQSMVCLYGSIMHKDDQFFSGESTNDPSFELFKVKRKVRKYLFCLLHPQVCFTLFTKLTFATSCLILTFVSTALFLFFFLKSYSCFKFHISPLSPLFSFFSS